MSFGEGGFGAVLADAYARRMDVRNRGFSGYNTRWARHYPRSVLDLPCVEARPTRGKRRLSTGSSWFSLARMTPRPGIMRGSTCHWIVRRKSGMDVQ